MKKVRSKKISAKITQAIVSTALLGSFVVGLSGIICTIIINNKSQQMYNQNLEPMTPMYKVSADYLSIRTELRNLILTTGDQSATEKSITAAFDDINTQLNTYEKAISSEEERTAFNIIKNGISSYSQTADSIIKYVDADNKDKAFQELQANSVADQLNASIEKTFTLNTNEAQQTNQEATIIFYICILIITVIITLVVFVARKQGKRVASDISDPINKMVAAADSISKGNLDVNVSVNTEDETSILAAAFTRIIDSLHMLKTDVDMLVSEAVEGRLDTRADLSRHEGDYREIIDGVNKTLDTVKAPLDVASTFITNLADGTSQSDIKKIYKGYYATLIDDLNNVHHSLVILLKESHKLEEAGKNGDLEVRGEESKLKGFYAGIIHGVNSTFDSIKAPLDVAAVFIDKLATGEASEALENTYKGYYATLIDNLNNVMYSLKILLNESQKLTQAGQNGELDVRGDVSKAKGSYAEIIMGMNGIFEAVAEPLNESAIVLGKMAVNDYTTAMSGNYNGRFAELSDSVNSVMDTLHKIEKIFLKVSEGDISLLETYKSIGKRSENDQIIPGAVSMMQAIKDLMDQSNKLAAASYEGNLSARGDVEKFRGGYRQIIEGMNNTIAAASAPIDEAAKVLKEVANGDMTVEMSGEYKGEYNIIKTSLNHAINSFNQVLSEISIAASQVSVGSKQVSDASQSLSQGATEQASSIEELTSTIAEISAQTKQNAKSAALANDETIGAKEALKQGNEKMVQLLGSMSEINESSTNISKIIKVIDDIAFQTNILALNAAVEAARAGQYGKGFAVVAEEVRNLAGKSAQAAKETTALIEGSISKVVAGTKIANETADMLGKIVESSQKSADLVSGIATASNEQATAIAQIDQGVMQVSTVVQTNSATSVESAASSEELSGQAEMLMEMVRKFKIRKDSSVISQNAAESTNKSLDNEKSSVSFKNTDKSNISLTEEYGKY